MFERDLKKILEEKVKSGKVIVLIGPRQVGKTTLLKSIQKESEQVLFLNCDEPDVRNILENTSSSMLKNIIGKSLTVIIDEAQRVKNIGLTLKLLHDNFSEIKLFVTGSSSLELSNSVNESLTGRKFEYNLFPFSTAELIKNTSYIEEIRLLKKRLIFGSYPDVVNNPGEEKEILLNLSSSYLFKDVFEFQDIRRPEIVEKLLQALALQIGSEVSFNELSNLLGIDALTVRRYVDLLEKAYVIFHLSSYSKNVRNELKKSVKIYFYDNGIRNAVISNFNSVDLRNDVGALWENFLISERLKNNAFNNIHAKYYFWRTTQKQEVDFLEEIEGNITAWEFKYNPLKAKTKCPKTFSENYPEISYGVVTSENYTEFVAK